MNNTNLDFEQAKIKHLLFKSRLRSLLYGVEVDEAPVLSELECTLGKWIYSHALKEYGAIPEMQELEKVHKEIHTQAALLVTLYKEGKENQARIGLTRIEEISAQLETLLIVVEEKINTIGKVSGQYQPIEVDLQELHDLRQSNQQLDKIIKQQSHGVLQERQLLYDVFMQLPAQISVLRGPDYIFELINPQAQEIVGRKNLIGKKAKEEFPELEPLGYFELLDEVFETGEPFKGFGMPAQINKEDGSVQELYVNVTYLPFRDSEGKIEGIISFTYDVTETILSRKRIQESEERFRFMSDALPVQSWTANEDGRVDYVNKRTQDYFGLSADEIVARGWESSLHEEDLAAAAATWAESVKTKKPYEVSFRLRDAEGRYRWHLARANPFELASGTTKWFGSNTDIHEMKLLQDQLKQSYEDLEVKVKFRNLELERQNVELQKKINELSNPTTS